jgi:hypothetical protein
MALWLIQMLYNTLKHILSFIRLLCLHQQRLLPCSYSYRLAIVLPLTTYSSDCYLIIQLSSRLAAFQTNLPRFFIKLSELSSAGGSLYTVTLLKKKSKSCYDWRSVLVSSPLWNFWPDIIFCLKVAVLSPWGALSDERSGMSLVSHCQQYLVHCQKFNIIYILHVTRFIYTVVPCIASNLVCECFARRANIFNKF